MSRRCALIIGNSDYEDPTLSQLKTPEADVRTLSEVLRKPDVGGFDEVQELINQPEAVVSRAISTFFAQKKPDDLLLLYFSGHGVLDTQGRLFLAVKDTQRSLLNATAIPASFVTDDMDSCRSKRQLLILDCCHSGAFARGAKGSAPALTKNTFEGNGYGRVVLTASDSTQYALEGDQVIEQAALSLFTHYLLEGLTTGQADSAQDGLITLDEWYDYAYERVAGETPNQTPRKWVYNQQGELVIARNPAPVKPEPKELPPELKEAISSRFVGVRVDALQELKRLLNGNNPALQQAAKAALTSLVEQDDSRQVSGVAAAILAEYSDAHPATPGSGPESPLAPPPNALEVDPKVEQEKLERQRAREAARQAETDRLAREQAEAQKQAAEQKHVAKLPLTHDFSCQLRPQSFQVGQPALLIITNQSATITGAYSIQGSDPDSALTFSFSPALVQIPPGSSAEVQVRADLRSPLWVGNIRRHSIRVQVTATTGAEQTEVGEVISGPGRISGRMLTIGIPILAAGVLCVVLGIFALNNIAKGSRTAQLTSTASSKDTLVAQLVLPTSKALTATAAAGKVVRTPLQIVTPTPKVAATLGIIVVHASPTAPPDIVDPTLPAVVFAKPTALPDQVLFSSNRDGDWDIYMMNGDGSQVRQLTNDPADDSYPSFSPDGSQILFHSNREGNYDIFTMNLDGSDLVNLTGAIKQADTFASWFPNGKQIIFQSKRDGPKQIFVMNADGSDQGMLISGQNGQDVASPAVSPNGRKIVFVCDRDDIPTICIYDIESTSQVYLVPDLTRQADPSWSPDGRRVLYVETSTSGLPMQISVIDATGSGASIFHLGDANMDYSHPRLSSDGQYIYYEGSAGGASDLYRYNVKSGSSERLTDDPASDAEPYIR